MIQRCRIVVSLMNMPVLWWRRQWTINVIDVFSAGDLSRQMEVFPFLEFHVLHLLIQLVENFKNWPLRGFHEMCWYSSLQIRLKKASSRDFHCKGRILGSNTAFCYRKGNSSVQKGIWHQKTRTQQKPSKKLLENKPDKWGVHRHRNENLYLWKKYWMVLWVHRK